LRHRPSAPLLAMMRYRLASFPRRTARRLEARRRWGAAVARAGNVAGADHAVHTHWLIPVLVDDLERARAALRAAGIDASGPSNVVYLGPRPAIMDRLLFVPAYPELPRATRRSILRAVEKAC
jgi:perosamine synthetase